MGVIRAEFFPDGKALRLKGTPYLAGSALTPDWSVINVVRRCGVPSEAAWAMASVQPARLAGLQVPAAVKVTVGEQGFSLCQ